MNVPALKPTETRLADLARRGPSVTRVLFRHGLDFCCGGTQTLEEACRQAGVLSTPVVRELDEAAELALSRGEAAPDWDQRPLDEVIDHIMIRYHANLLEDLDRIEALARKVERVHGDVMPDVLPELARTFGALAADLRPHLLKEEEILFPMIRQGHGEMAVGPISVMEAEHEEAGELLRRLRGWIAVPLPEEACGSWRALWSELATLIEDTLSHIHLENHILFPRALRGE